MASENVRRLWLREGGQGAWPGIGGGGGGVGWGGVGWVNLGAATAGRRLGGGRGDGEFSSDTDGLLSVFARGIGGLSGIDFDPK